MAYYAIYQRNTIEVEADSITEAKTKAAIELGIDSRRQNNIRVIKK